jgi:hypothetical protein
MDLHIQEIIAIAQEGKYDGIEMDYERIWVDEEIGTKFSSFVNKLAVEAIKNKLKLRIVLEPGIPFHYTYFARGPEYVVMLYNLFGTHSGPGPKADNSFIAKTISRMEALPSGRAVALSTGGCLWGGAGEKRFLTEQEARSLLLKHAANSWQWDKKSNCVYFDYQIDGTNYTVWYADVQTLNFWINAAKKVGERNISLWRLGGNIEINKVK